MVPGFFLRPVAMPAPEGELMKNQTRNAIDQGTWATRDITPAKAKSMIGSGFERRFCGVLIALIFAIAAIASVVLTHLSASVVPPDLLSVAFSDLR